MNFDPRSQLRRSVIAWILALLCIMILAIIFQVVVFE